MASVVNVHFLPNLTSPQQLAGRTVVVIDVLRATTTICTALGNGAAKIIPCLEVEETMNLAANARKLGQAVLLGGERNGLPLPGFDLGNSPAEYGRAMVQGKTIYFSTSNGTKAMMGCVGADHILLAGFVNFSAVARRLMNQSEVDIVCAGTHGLISREDVLLAGAIAGRLRACHDQIECNDSASLAIDAWRSIAGDQISRDSLADELRFSHGGANLVRIGHQSDLMLAADLDRWNFVPCLDQATWTIMKECENG
ncbi:MAG: 2-phosphosulfolactate phosphatase [Planctomycetales bacterium]|nr:2-phosphosulfolactate phosphatase [Planctomycetales bacterium]